MTPAQVWAAGEACAVLSWSLLSTHERRSWRKAVSRTDAPLFHWLGAEADPAP